MVGEIGIQKVLNMSQSQSLGRFHPGPPSRGGAAGQADNGGASTAPSAATTGRVSASASQVRRRPQSPAKIAPMRWLDDAQLPPASYRRSGPLFDALATGARLHGCLQVLVLRPGPPTLALRCFCCSPPCACRGLHACLIPDAGAHPPITPPYPLSLSREPHRPLPASPPPQIPPIPELLRSP